MKRGLHKLVKDSFVGFVIDVPQEGKPVKVTIEYSFDDPHDLTSELWAAVIPEVITGRLPGRQKLLTTEEILKLVKQAKEEKRPFSHVGRRFGIKDKKVTDLVRYYPKKGALTTTPNKS